MFDDDGVSPAIRRDGWDRRREEDGTDAGKRKPSLTR